MSGELALSALWRHLEGSGARESAAGLVDALSRQLAMPVLLVATDDRGGERWRCGTEPATVPPPVDRPLQHQGARVGSLRLSVAGDSGVDAALLRTLALLLARDRSGADGPPGAEQTAIEAKARLEAIAAHVPGLLYQFALKPDLTARFVFVSQQVNEVMGVDAATVTHDAADVFGAVVREDRPALLESVFASARDLSVWRHEFRVRRLDGGVRWMHGSASPQRDDDGTVNWFGYMQDITDRHELDRVRRDAAVAAAANREKTEFLSRMSHELRTPLNAVLGFAQLMEIDPEEPPGPTQRRRLALIRGAGDHLLRMIGDLLDLTRIESGTLALAIEAVPLAPLADDALAMLQATASQAQVTLALHDASAGAGARADRTRLRQVLLNLLTNAIKYNRPGGRVDLHLGVPAAGEVSLHVRDTGHGIAESDLPRLFEPFHRGRHAQGAVEGTGIGLSLSRSLVQLMGGRIEVRSTLGVGSEFSVTLPAA